MPPTLLDIHADYHALDSLLAECGGDISDPQVEQYVDQLLAELSDNMADKVDNYAAFISELQARSKTREDEAKRLLHKATSDTNTAKWLKERLLFVLASLGEKKVETARYTVSRCANGGKQSLDIYDPEQVPDDLWRTIPARRELDNEAIRDAIDAGEIVPGVTLMERGEHLRIK